MEEPSEQENVPETKPEMPPPDISIQCLFSRKPCKRKRLKGFDFCHKHILEDKNSPFQQCSFVIKSSEERCINPAPKVVNKKTFCLIHTRDPKLKKAHDEIMRRNMKRKLANRKAALERKKGSTEASTNTQRSPNELKKPKEEDSEPILAIELDGIYRLQENGRPRSEVTWFDENSSDAESLDSEEEDPLRHAGVWTVEEALKICRDKMIRKRSLYLEQYKRLTLLLKERKRKHLLRMAGLCQNYPSDIPGATGEAAEDRLSLAEIRALGLYQHINGTEILLDRQAREKRSRSTAPKISPQNSCHYETNSERCTNKVLPFTNFCNEHICSDPHQKLFKRCTFEAPETNIRCDNPVGQMYRGTTCKLHATLLPRFPSEGMESLLHPESSSEKTDIPADSIDADGGNDVEMKPLTEVPDDKKTEQNTALPGYSAEDEKEAKFAAALQNDTKTQNGLASGNPSVSEEDLKGKECKIGLKIGHSADIDMAEDASEVTAHSNQQEIKDSVPNTLDAPGTESKTFAEARKDEESSKNEGGDSKELSHGTMKEDGNT